MFRISCHSSFEGSMPVGLWQFACKIITVCLGKLLRNVRNSGLLFAFDFDTKELRDRFVKNLHENNMLCNPTGDFTVRLRPNLCVKKNEIDHASQIISKSVS